MSSSNPTPLQIAHEQRIPWACYIQDTRSTLQQPSARAAYGIRGERSSTHGLLSGLLISIDSVSPKRSRTSCQLSGHHGPSGYARSLALCTSMDFWRSGWYGVILWYDAASCEWGGRTGGVGGIDFIVSTSGGPGLRRFITWSLGLIGRNLGLASTPANISITRHVDVKLGDEGPAALDRAQSCRVLVSGYRNMMLITSMLRYYII
jgi:hypothetical protein